MVVLDAVNDDETLEVRENMDLRLEGRAELFGDWLVSLFGKF